MIFSIFTVIIALIGLLVIHELGHFLVAKKLDMKVLEFGVGYPPRVFGKKIGETMYSLNLLPFGAFVRIEGEEENVQSERSFSAKPVHQRILVVLAGAMSFFLISYLIFTIISITPGVSYPIDDSVAARDAFLQVVGVAKNSPAQKSGIHPGDKIVKACAKGGCVDIDKIKTLQDFTAQHQGEIISLFVKQKNSLRKKDVLVRTFPPENEGPLGIAIVRVVQKKSKWFVAPWQGAKLTFQKTLEIPQALFWVLKKKIHGEKVEGVEFLGPVGVGSLMVNALKGGWDNFLILLAMISLWLAIFNLLPIPALDGGKILFLMIEGLRKKPVSQVVEQRISTLFFLVLLGVMVFVTIRDIFRIVQ